MWHRNRQCNRFYYLLETLALDLVGAARLPIWLGLRALRSDLLPESNQGMVRLGKMSNEPDPRWICWLE